MPSRGPNRLFSVTAWGVTALLAVAVSAGQARAECGDYVHIGPAAATSDNEAPPKPPAPCHGPNCALQKHAPAPLAPVSPPAEPGPGDAILTAATPPDPGHTTRLGSHDPTLPVGHSQAVFHPPRLG